MTEKEVLLKGNKEKKTSQKPQKKKIGGWTSFLLILVGMAALFFGPLPAYLFSLIPEPVVRAVMAPLFQEIVLYENPEKFSEPRKFKRENPLPVLGRDTSLCFFLQSTVLSENIDAIDLKRLEEARRGKAIAEIIAVGTNGIEYKLDDATLNMGSYIDNSSKNQSTSIVCHKFSRRHSLLPATIKAVYIRPHKPFTPSKVTWFTKKDIRQRSF